MGAPLPALCWTDGNVAEMDRAVGVLVGVSRELPAGQRAVLARQPAPARESRPPRGVLGRHGDHLAHAADLSGFLRRARVLRASPAAVAAAPPRAAADLRLVPRQRAARGPAAALAAALAEAAAELVAVACRQRRAVPAVAGVDPVRVLRADLAGAVGADAGHAGLARLPLHELDDAALGLRLLVADPRPPAAPAGTHGRGHARAVAGHHDGAADPCRRHCHVLAQRPLSDLRDL